VVSAVAASVDKRVTQAWAVLDTVLDPEVPVVSVRDLGIVRDVVASDEGLEIVLTPTYSGCPAIEAIEHDVRAALVSAGLAPVRVRMQRAPAWTTDWISETGRRKLRDYGIVPPQRLDAGDGVPMRWMPKPAPLVCPHCASSSTERLSAFGSTACKALYRCLACGEPFEHFKAI
jgi:ring-1,2-phenylacetyl-CoA epoxidase subunit PaaD